MYRDKTKVIHIGDRVIGGGNPILIQSMTNTKTNDVAATVAQIRRLAKAGCDIVRCTVPDLEAAKAIAQIKAQLADISIPLVADIHFDYKMAVAGGQRALSTDSSRCKQRVARKGIDRAVSRRHGGGYCGERTGQSAYH